MPEPTKPATRSVSERGHAKNLETIKKMRDFAAGWGANYTPTNAILKLTFVNTRIADGETVNSELQTVRAPYKVAASVAEDAFEPLSKLMTRLEHGFKSSGVPDSAVEDLKTYTRKVKSGKKKTVVNPDPAVEPEVPEKGHSGSQMSRVNRTDNLDSGIAVLVAYNFDPNEADLKPAALTAFSNGLKAKTEAVNTAYVPVSNKLNDRDEIFYLAPDSLFEIADAMEDYAVSRFGFDSPEHNQIRGLEFKKYLRKKK